MQFGRGRTGRQAGYHLVVQSVIRRVLGNAQIYEGTNQIQRVVIGRRLLA